MIAKSTLVPWILRQLKKVLNVILAHVEQLLKVRLTLSLCQWPRGSVSWRFSLWKLEQWSNWAFVFAGFYTGAHLKSTVFLSIIKTRFSMRSTEIHVVLLRFTTSAGLKMTCIILLVNSKFEHSPPRESPGIRHLAFSVVQNCHSKGKIYMYVEFNVPQHQENMENL